MAYLWWQVQQYLVLLRILDGMTLDTSIQHLWQDLSHQVPTPTDMEGMIFHVRFFHN
jgi:hypothetical protein